MTAAESELMHEIRKARAEVGDMRAALLAKAVTIEEHAMAVAEGDVAKAATIAAELAHSAFFFKAFQVASVQNRALREEIARLKEKQHG